MKFGEQLEANIHEKWRSYYVQYRAYKQLVVSVFPKKNKKQKKKKKGKLIGPSTSDERSLLLLDTPLGPTYTNAGRHIAVPLISQADHHESSEAVLGKPVEIQVERSPVRVGIDPDARDDDTDSEQVGTPRLLNPTGSQASSPQHSVSDNSASESPGSEPQVQSPSTAEEKHALPVSSAAEHSLQLTTSNDAEENTLTDTNADLQASGRGASWMGVNTAARKDSEDNSGTDALDGVDFDAISGLMVRNMPPNERTGFLIEVLQAEVSKVNEWYRLMEAELLAQFRSLRSQVRQVLVKHYMYKKREGRRKSVIKPPAITRSPATHTLKPGSIRWPSRTRMTTCWDVMMDAVSRSKLTPARGNIRRESSAGPGRVPSSPHEDLIPGVSLQGAEKKHRTGGFLGYLQHHRRNNSQEVSALLSSTRSDRGLQPIDATGAAELLLHHHQAFISMLRRTIFLQNFVALNMVAFEKLSKALEKHSGEDGVQKRVLRRIRHRYFVRSKRTSEYLIPRTYAFFADVYENGNVDAAKVTMLAKMTTSSLDDKGYVMFGAKIGAVAVLITWALVAWLSVPRASWDLRDQYEDTHKLHSAHGALSYAEWLLYARLDIASRWQELGDCGVIYRWVGLVVFWWWLYGIAVMVWTRYRVSFVYIFEFNPRTRLTHLQILSEAANMTIVYLLNAVLLLTSYVRPPNISKWMSTVGKHGHLRHFYEHYGTSSYGWLAQAISVIIPIPMENGLPLHMVRLIYPAALLFYVFYRCFLPWASYWKSRNFLMDSLRNVFTAPFGRVRFIDSYVADVMTSMAKIFVDLQATACLLGVGGLVGHTSTHGTLENLEAHNGLVVIPPPSGICATIAHYLVPVVCALPLWIRFQQCMKRYYETGHRFPHLLNALKYAIAHSVVIVSSFHPTFSSGWGNWTGLRLIWIASFVVSTMYTYLWDVLMDWGLFSFHPKAEHRLLRPVLMYHRPAFYYWCIVSNFFLRFAWVITIVPFPFEHVSGLQSGFSKSTYNQVVLPFLIAAELFRRWQWSLLRVEFEHLTNGSGFRKTKYVPMFFDSARAMEMRLRKSGSGYGVTVEIFVMIALLLLVAVIGANLP